MYQRIGYQDPGDHLAWHDHSAMITEARRSGEIDDAVNEDLMARVQSNDAAVFDSWALPYLFQRNPRIAGQIFFLRLDSDINSRAIRCIVSQGPVPSVSISSAVSLVRSKDRTTRDQFKRLYGFDIISGRGAPRVAQSRVNISDFVYGSSPYQVRRGVRMAHAKITAALQAAGILERRTH